MLVGKWSIDCQSNASHAAKNRFPTYNLVVMRVCRTQWNLLRKLTWNSQIFVDSLTLNKKSVWLYIIYMNHTMQLPDVTQHSHWHPDMGRLALFVFIHIIISELRFSSKSNLNLMIIPLAGRGDHLRQIKSSGYSCWDGQHTEQIVGQKMNY